jgi:hypothetical protein
MKLVCWRRPRKVEVATSRLQHIEPELLAMILTFLVDTDEDSSTAPDSANISRASDLRSIGLVCRSWQAVSQDFLYEHPRPQSLKALKQLRKVLRRNSGLAQRVKSLSPPIYNFWGTMDDMHSNFKQGWRPSFLPTEVASFAVLSRNDYFSNLRMFREVAMMCPNLTHFSLPILLKFRLSVIPPVSWTGLDISRLISLTLSPPPIPQWIRKVSQLSSLAEPLRFPKLKKLKLIGLIDFDTNETTITDCFQTPVLEEIIISGIRMTSDSLMKFIKPVERKLISLDLMGDTGLHLVGGGLGQLFWPNSLPIPGGIKRFAVQGMYRMGSSPLRNSRPLFTSSTAFKRETVPSLETLRLYVDTDSALTELSYFYPSLQVLHIDYHNEWPTPTPTNRAARFHLVDYLVYFVRNKDIFVPELRQITLDWTLFGIHGSAFDCTTCYLAYRFQEGCDKYGVKLALKMKHGEV